MRVGFTIGLRGRANRDPELVEAVGHRPTGHVGLGSFLSVGAAGYFPRFSDGGIAGSMSTFGDPGPNGICFECALSGFVDRFQIRAPFGGFACGLC